MSTILLIDPDPRERARIASGIGARGRTIVSCASVDEGVLACAESPQFVVLGILGHAPNAAADIANLHARWPRVDVLIAAAEDVDLPNIAVGGAVHIDRRPVSLRRLALLIKRRATTSAVGLPRVGLADLIQMACIGGHTMRISCARAEVDVGSVDVVGGRLVSARDAESRGVEALSRLLHADIRARVHELEEAPLRDIELDWQHALFEAMRLADERKHPNEPSFEERMRDVSSALLARDYAKAALVLGHAAQQRPDDPIVRVNIERLRKLGYEPAEKGPRER